MKALIFTFFTMSTLLAWASDITYRDQPLREISIIITNEGYYPKNVVAYEGERIRFFVTSTAAKPDCLVVQDHPVFLSAERGRMTEGQAVALKAGKYKIFCPSSKSEGSITVLGKVGEDPIPSNKRSIASEPKKPKYWLPRDYD